MRFQIAFWAGAFVILFISGLPHISAAASLLRNGVFAVAGILSTSLFLPLSVASNNYRNSARIASWVAAVIVLTLAITATGNVATFWNEGTPPAQMSFQQWTAGGLHFIWVMISWALALEFFVTSGDVAVETTITRQQAENAFRPQFLLVDNAGGQSLNIQLAQITHLTAAGDYVAAYSGGKEYLARGPLKSLAERLAPAGFVQVSRSALVNRHQIEKIAELGRGRFDIQLKGGGAVATSRRSAETVKTELNL